MMPLAPRCYLLALFVTPLCALPLVAGVGVWTPLGPDGGSATAVVLDPRNPDTVYTVTPRAGLFKSINGGRRWSRLDALAGDVVAVALLADPRGRAATVLASTGSVLWRSNDAGLSWQRSDTGLPAFGAVTDLGAAAGDTSIVYAASAGTQARLFRSRDRGRSWERADNGLPQRFVDSVAVDPLASRIAYAATATGLFFTNNAGQTWRSHSPATSGISAIAVDPALPRVLYAATSPAVGARIHRSADRGATWARADGDLVAQRVLCLAIDPRSHRTVYAGTDAGVWKSVDAGRHWRRSGPESAPIGDLALHPNGAVAYAATVDPPILKTNSGGAHWASFSRGIRAAELLWVAVDAVDPGTLRVGHANGGMSRSHDRGESWQRIAGVESSVWAIAQTVPNPARIYAGSSDGLLVSNDGGVSWELRSGDGAPADVGEVVVDPHDADRIWVVSDGVRASEDGGLTWSAPAGGPTSHLALLPIAEPPVLLTTGFIADVFDPRFIIRRSLDGGVTWSTELEGGGRFGFSDLTVNPLDAYQAWASNPLFGVYRTDDGGEGWSHLPALQPSELAADPQTVGQVVAATGGTIHVSLDGGATWGPLATLSPTAFVWELVFDPHRAGTVLAATDGAGVQEITLAND